MFKLLIFFNLLILNGYPKETIDPTTHRNSREVMREQTRKSPIIICFIITSNELKPVFDRIKRLSL